MPKLLLFTQESAEEENGKEEKEKRMRLNFATTLCGIKLFFRFA
jgi:hypothetical protein